MFQLTFNFKLFANFGTNHLWIGSFCTVRVPFMFHFIQIVTIPFTFMNFPCIIKCNETNTNSYCYNDTTWAEHNAAIILINHVTKQIKSKENWKISEYLLSNFAKRRLLWINRNLQRERGCFSFFIQHLHYLQCDWLNIDWDGSFFVSIERVNIETVFFHSSPPRKYIYILFVTRVEFRWLYFVRQTICRWNGDNRLFLDVCVLDVYALSRFVLCRFPFVLRALS